MKRYKAMQAQGFTLIEITGALLIFALMAMPLISMQFSMLKSVSRSYNSICAILALRAYPVELERAGKFTVEKAAEKTKGQKVSELRFESTTEHPAFKRKLELVIFKPKSVGKDFTSARIVWLSARPDSADENEGPVSQLITFMEVAQPKEDKKASDLQKMQQGTKVTLKPGQSDAVSVGQKPGGLGKKP